MDSWHDVVKALSRPPDNVDSAIRSDGPGGSEHILSSNHGTTPTTRYFHKFPNLPPELRRMIWREFFLEPRYFVANFNDRYRFEELDRGMWMWSMEPMNHTRAHYNLFDTTIDRMSSSVALGLRHRVRFPTWCHTWNSSEGDDNWTQLASAMHDFPQIRINWETDFVRMAPLVGSIPTDTVNFWWANIQNLLLNTHPSSAMRPGRGTKENLWLWRHRHTFPRLKVLRHVKPLSASIAETHWAHFQMRYWLRESPETPPQWRNIRCETTDLSPEMSLPEWTQTLTYFLRESPEAPARWRNIRRKTTDLSLDISRPQWPVFLKYLRIYKYDRRAWHLGGVFRLHDEEEAGARELYGGLDNFDFDEDYL